MTAPPDVREVDEKIAEVRLRKESAIDAQDFEGAASLRDEERQLQEERQRREQRWKAGEMDVLSEIGEEEIAEVLVWTGIPVFKLTEEETEKLLRMEDEIHKRIISQHEAISAVSRAMRRTRSGLKDHAACPARSSSWAPRREDRALQGPGRVPVRRRGRADPARHVRVHGEAHGFAADRFPPGYVGYEEGGQLTEAVRASRSASCSSTRPEGPPRRVQHAPADPRGRTPDGRAGAPGRLQEHDHHHDFQPRDPGHRQGRRDRVHGGAGRRRDLREDEGDRHRGALRSFDPSSSTGSTRRSSSTRSRRRT